MVVKTAVSLDQHLYRKGEALSRKLKVSRSRLLSMALDEFIRRRENEDLLRRLNAAYSSEPDAGEQRVLSAALAAHARRLSKEKW